MNNSDFLPEPAEAVKIYVPGSFASAARTMHIQSRESDEVRIYTAGENNAGKEEN